MAILGPLRHVEGNISKTPLPPPPQSLEKPGSALGLDHRVRIMPWLGLWALELVSTSIPPFLILSGRLFIRSVPQFPFGRARVRFVLIPWGEAQGAGFW